MFKYESDLINDDTLQSQKCVNSNKELKPKEEKKYDKNTQGEFSIYLDDTKLGVLKIDINENIKKVKVCFTEYDLNFTEMGVFLNDIQETFNLLDYQEIRFA